MKRKKERLKILLIISIALFLILGISAVAISGYKKHIVAKKEKQEMLEILKKMPKATPTPAATATPTPEPTATPTPTPVITMRATFNPDDYWNTWYSADGLVSLNIYNISNKSVSFSFSQANRADGAHVCEADVTAEVAGNAATFSFNDSFGSSAAGSLTFDGGNLYVNIRTEARAEGTAVSPEVSGLFTREKKEAPKPEPTATPVPEEKPEKKPEETEKTEGDYIFPESNTRYLTDEEISGYSSKELELAKNEIYARRGRIFITERIADYFNGKSWYQGTVSPEEFDAKQDQIFNEYESANVSKIAQWEEKKRNEGK